MRSAWIVLVACHGAAVAPVEQRPAPAPERVVRLIVGGDARDDTAHVLPWAFREARARGAAAFLFLGDMELVPGLDPHFARELALLDPVPFYPVLGNHELVRRGLKGVSKRDLARRFGEVFLGTSRTPVTTAIDGKVTYAVDLPGGVRFIALDNVTQKGFGADQLAWLERALRDASADPRVRHVVVGMHKPLARNGITRHSMDHDGARALADSDAALALLARYKVALVLAGHDHRYASYTHGTVRSYITGGLGAPLDRTKPADAFHHFLQLEIRGDGELRVEVVRFPGTQTVGDDDDDD